MPVRFAIPALFLAVLAGTFSPGSTRALAFSQITGEDGESLPQRGDGIISVPLPPVSNGDAPDGGQAEQTSPAVSPPAVSPPAVSPPAGLPSVAPATGGSSGTQAVPGSAASPTGPAATQPTATAPASTEPAGTEPAVEQPAGEATEPPAVVRYGSAELPQPVRDLRERLIAIAKSGDIEALRPYLQTGPEPTVVSSAEEPGDPVAFLQTASGDGKGVEILAILLELLQGGYVHLDAENDEEIYVWPYFTEVALDKLSRAQLVELFEIVTAGDYERMVANGAYDFYRVGISPDGRLEFLVAGD